MAQLTTEKTREIIEDFRKLIQEKSTPGPKPSTYVINFRNDKQNNIERPIVLVPINLLRFRLDNGRIASDVLSYKYENGPLDEKDDNTQKLLKKFLLEKDPEKTDNLKKSIAHTSQIEPAIITCDGFLINGNRRKMAMELLLEENPGKAEFETMKVVILPGEGEPGGPPTLLEIERLENRYQLQSDGKAEYYGFDKALSIKRKEEIGFTLEQQLRDDSRYVDANEAEIKKAIREIQKTLLFPLECVDRYLDTFKRQGLYASISSRVNDREGRWQAFIDYSNTYHNQFCNTKWRMENGIEDTDIGILENAAFKLIRLRNLKDLGKIHNMMRDLPKICSLPESRKELIHISNKVPDSLPANEQFHQDGTTMSIEENDKKWTATSQQDILYHLKRAVEYKNSHKDKETPVTLLEAALKKLTHPDMQVASMRISDLSKTRNLVSEIQKIAKDIEHDIYDAQKNHKNLSTKK